MEGKSLHEVLGRLNHDQVKYLVAGGFAVVAHGHLRFTQDLDLILAKDLQDIEALERLRRK